MDGYTLPGEAEEEITAVQSWKRRVVKREPMCRENSKHWDGKQNGRGGSGDREWNWDKPEHKRIHSQNPHLTHSSALPDTSPPPARRSLLQSDCKAQMQPTDAPSTKPPIVLLTPYSPIHTHSPHSLFYGQQGSPDSWGKPRASQKEIKTNRLTLGREQVI